MGLLAYLAVRRAPQMGDHLRGLLWPKFAPDAAHKNLRKPLCINGSAQHKAPGALDRLLGVSILIERANEYLFGDLRVPHIAPAGYLY